MKLEWKLLNYVEKKNIYVITYLVMIVDVVGIVGLLLLIFWTEMILGDVEIIGEMLPKFR